MGKLTLEALLGLFVLPQPPIRFILEPRVFFDGVVDSTFKQL